MSKIKTISSKYEEQLLKEKRNKEIFNLYTKDSSVGDYYMSHSQLETMNNFNIPTKELLRKILLAINFDFKMKRHTSAMKGKKATRSHESYILGGKKSAETQITNWNNKTKEEKEAWSLKQSLAHLNSPSYKEIKGKQNRVYKMSLSPEERKLQNEMRSETMKKWWSQFSDEEKAEIMKNKFKNGAGYNIRNSKPNNYFANLLDDNHIDYTREFYLDKYSYDFKIDNNLIEINPTVTHNVTWSPFDNKIEKNYHFNKTLAAVTNGYRCIHIFDWEDKYKIIKLLSNQDRIEARKCKVKEVAKKEAQNFINENHTQNYAKDKVRLGLYYNNELVSIMTFDKPRYNKNYEWELVRFCSTKKVIGGCEKLFKHFIRTFNPKSVISYCDLSKFTGHTYIKLGFKLLRKTKPTKHWYNEKTKEHITDNLLRQRGFDQLFGTSFGKGTSNEELMLNNGFVEIYDCGQATYIWSI